MLVFTLKFKVLTETCDYNRLKKLHSKTRKWRSVKLVGYWKPLQISDTSIGSSYSY